MIFTRLALFALPILGLASPVVKEDNKAISKRDTTIDVLNGLNVNIDNIISQVGTIDTNNVNVDQISTALTAIVSALSQATTAVSTSAAKRALMGDFEKRDDLQEAGTVLAAIITKVLQFVKQLLPILDQFPLLGSLVASIQTGLVTLLKGVDLVLVGVVQVVSGLLSGLSGLLTSLQFGLLAGLLGL
ncbi:hypothetical protein M231_05344 [Tremella mesenterica]|uniref:Uncharacterized protein n=1 Tax=Tremella mesenterica TaxID=5217 RepID=A0A4V1M3M2_TREME|nr:hypothetical protein M231_05344 [Tremella mesenterica]